jgi:hypothetical protein
MRKNDKYIFLVKNEIWHVYDMFTTKNLCIRLVYDQKFMYTTKYRCIRRICVATKISLILKS